MHSEVLIFKILYKMFCNIFIIVDTFFNLLSYINRKYVEFYHTCSINDDIEYVHKSATKIKKIPRHLTVLLCDEEPSYGDLANLIIWSFVSGISFISFYESKGILKSMETKLQEAVAKRKVHNDILWYNSDQSNRNKNGYMGDKIYVRTLSVLDGRQNIIDITKRLCGNSDYIVNQEKIDMHLKENYIFPDPDLGLYCGNIFSICGYPPWEVRTTEFLSIGTHYNIKAYQFVKALYSYSKTEQRLGK